MSKLQPYTSIGGALREALKILKTSGPKDLRGGGMCSNISLVLECVSVKITRALECYSGEGLKLNESVNL